MTASLAVCLFWSCLSLTFFPSICRAESGDGKQAGERMVLSINGVEYPFRWCPAGTFTMGSPADEQERYSDETQLRVTLTRGFWMLETQVTQAMWTGGEKNGRLPFNDATWFACRDYVQKLNGLGVAPEGYRFSLPSEAQWEYACRAGTMTPFHFGSVLDGDKANFDGNYPYGTTTKGNTPGKPVEVGSYPANAWGLYDMHGNGWEWCSDIYGAYPEGNVTDPQGASSGRYRVMRGGYWHSSAANCRSAARRGEPSGHFYSHGLRISLVCDENVKPPAP